MSIARVPRSASVVAAVAAAVLSVLVLAPPAQAVTSNTPVWIGAPFAGKYGSEGTQPGSHGGNQVAFDFFAPSGTVVKLYAAPKNTAYNNAITAVVKETGISRPSGTTQTAAQCGYYARIEIRHNGNPIGLVSFHHLSGVPAPGTAIARWGGTVGTVANLPLSSGASCYQVTTAAGRHTHIEFRNYGTRPACAHDYGQVSRVAGNYQGYLGDYGKAPLTGNRCPSGI